jgi:D-alanyl-lipoteichoic acid acyltransferase DltB (MBOAT superfamily)
MLFNSLPFIFVFLPITFSLFFLLGGRNKEMAAAFLALASLIFYGWWDPRYVLLLLASASINFLLSRAIVRFKRQSRQAELVLFCAISANLLLLAYYKYTNFFIANFDLITGWELAMRSIVLPLGISFFTFTQIAFLADTYRGEASEPGFTHYLLFITYFPHLIAGPILHHKEMMPQFSSGRPYKISTSSVATGVTLFVFGLIKKTICADGMSPVAQTVFSAAQQGSVGTFYAWCGALAYTMQIYFDFSGYSDMALGISALFGISLPLNFDSPYKASSIIGFWRCWHMTLSRFLRDYLYIPLGGNRRSGSRRYVNLLVTMVLGGLWHGAAWTYVAWGGLHGLYLMINHGWRYVSSSLRWRQMPYLLGLGLTFLAVTIAWIFFRAPTFSTALSLIRDLFGFGGQHGTNIAVTNQQILAIAFLMAVAWGLPNAYQVLGDNSPALQHTTGPTSIVWRPNAWWAAGLGGLAALAVSAILTGAPSEFIYFQF